MHGCCDSIGCLNVSVSYLNGGGLKNASAHIVGDRLISDVFKASGAFVVDVFKANEDIVVSSKLMDNGLSVSASIVCVISRGAYLDVEPNTVWLTQNELYGEFDIYSNLVWVIS